MTPWSIPPDLWAGETVAIIGGGPSLTKDDVAYVAKSGCRTIAVNRSYLLLTADWLHACDGSFWQDHPDAYRYPAPFKTTLDSSHARDGVRWLRRTGVEGFDRKPGHVREGLNSGYQAIHCAIQAGAKAIILLGFDMKTGEKGRTHWHGGYTPRSTPGFAKFLPIFKTLLPILNERGIDVVNCSPDTVLTTFPRVPLREVI